VSAASTRARLNAEQAVALDPVREAREETKRIASSRTWAAIALARDLDTCRSILHGRPVMAALLDGEILRRALRGQPLPPANEFIRIRSGHLDAVVEAGPPPTAASGGKRR
jgi:hypothetical protein